MCPWPAGDQSSDPSCQNWTEQEHPVTPQQNNFENAYATRLACGIYTVLSSMYAVREWSIDFVEQSHINNARNWMAAVCHEIKETVSLERCKCGERYPSPRDLLPLQLKMNLPLQQVELDQMMHTDSDERSQHGEEPCADKDTLSPRARAPSPWRSTLVPRHESNTRASGLCHDVFNRISPIKLNHHSISPGSSALRSQNAPNPSKGISRAHPSNGDPST